MAQDFTLPAGTNEVLSTTVATNLPNAIKSLRSNFSGTAAPSSTVAYMFWADTTNNVLKMRNAANSAWVTIAPLVDSLAKQSVHVGFGDINATTTKYLLVQPFKGNVTRVQFVSNTATTSSVAATKEWTFKLTNVTDTQELFSSTPSTATSVGGVGGGAEVAIDTPYVLTPDQNALLDAGDVLEFEFGKVGAIEQLDRVALFLDFDYHGV